MACRGSTRSARRHPSQWQRPDPVENDVGEGSAVTVTSNSCADVAGNIATGVEQAFKVDKTAPVIVQLDFAQLRTAPAGTTPT